MTHICVSNLTTITSDNGLSPGRCQAITWTNAGILLIGPSGTTSVKLYRNSYIFIESNAFKNVVYKMVSISSRPQCVTHVTITYVALCAGNFSRMFGNEYEKYHADTHCHTNSSNTVNFKQLSCLEWHSVIGCLLLAFPHTSLHDLYAFNILSGLIMSVFGVVTWQR